MLSQQQIADLMITAIEGGSNYWCECVFVIEAGIDEVKKPWYSDPNVYNKKLHIQITEIGDYTNERYWSDFESAIKLMKKEYNHLYEEVINETYDAEAADVFLQLLMFGEIVYG